MNNPLTYSPGQIRKALLGALIAALGRLEAVVPAGVTGEEWVGVALVGVVAYAGVFGISNRTAEG